MSKIMVVHKVRKKNLKPFTGNYRWKEVKYIITSADDEDYDKCFFMGKGWAYRKNLEIVPVQYLGLGKEILWGEQPWPNMHNNI